MQLSVLDWLVLGGYLLLVFGLGLWFSRGNGTTERYFLGGRGFPGWALGLSLVGTSISSVTFLAYPADAFKSNWMRFLPTLMLPLAVWWAARYMLPYFRASGATTAYEFLEQRFGTSVRVYAAAVFIIAQWVRLATVLWLLALLLQQIIGLPPTTAIVCAGLFVGIYTVAGGIEAVVWTDVIQTLTLMLGGVVCLVVVLQWLPGGIMQVFELAWPAHKLSVGDWQQGNPQPVRWDLSLTTKTGTMLLLVGLTNWLTEYTSNQNTVQRFCAARSDQAAHRALWVCVATSLPLWAFYMFLGTALWALFQVMPQPVPDAILAGEIKAEALIPWFINTYLPSGLVGLVLAAALAAAMSSQDSGINAISTVAVTDLYKRLVRPHASDRHYLKAAWLMSSVSTLMMIGGALLLERATTDTLQDVIYLLTSLLGGGLLGLYVLGIRSQRGGATAAWCGIGATLLFTAWMLAGRQGWLPGHWQLPFDLYYVGLLGNLLLFTLSYALATLAARRRNTASRTNQPAHQHSNQGSIK